MSKKLRIGTRESQLAIWQAKHVKSLLKKHGVESELILIKSEGDLDLTTPLYAMGVQGIFTRSLDLALLNNQIDLAVHSMKDVPVDLPAALLHRSAPLAVREIRLGSSEDRPSAAAPAPAPSVSGSRERLA